MYKSLSPLYRKGVWGIGNINVGGKIVIGGKWLNLRHEPTALLCRFDWLHLGITYKHVLRSVCAIVAKKTAA